MTPFDDTHRMRALVTYRHNNKGKGEDRTNDQR